MFDLPDLLKRSASVYAAHPLLFIAIASVGQPLAIVHRLILPPALRLTDEFWLMEAWLAVVYAPFVMAGYVVSGALIRAVTITYRGSNPSFAGSYAAVLARLRRVLGVATAYWGATMLLPLTIVGIPFAINLMVRWTFDLQAAVIEDLKTVEALSFSSRLVKGVWWQVAGVVTLIAATVAAPGFAVLFLLRSTHPALVLIPSALAALVAPFLASLFTLLFFRLRERARELAPIPVLP